MPVSLIPCAGKDAESARWQQVILPLYALTLVMRFTGFSNPGLYHQGALTGWLRTVLGSPKDFSAYMSVDVLEQKKPRFMAGDTYRFTVYGIGEQGKAYLAGLPGAIMSFQCDWHKAMPFRDHWKLAGLEHFKPGERLAHDEIPMALDRKELQEDITFWQHQHILHQHTLRLDFTSPWRVLRAKEYREGKTGDRRYCHDGEDLKQGCLWLTRIEDSLRKLAEDHGSGLPERIGIPPLDVEIKLEWVNAGYKNNQGRIQPMGGLIGSIDIRNPAILREQDLALLVAGQYLGVGQRRVFGNGRYRMIGNDG